jgi:hypothetical protein
MSEETTQADAAALVAMTVADLAAHLDGVDLDTLNAALAQEQAGPNRKGAIAALEAAISGHPENAEAAAAAAEADGTALPGAISTVTEGLEDAPTDPNAVSVAPPRPHDSLVAQLELRWHELVAFVRPLEGEVEGMLGEVLAFVRSKI